MTVLSVRRRRKGEKKIGFSRAEKKSSASHAVTERRDLGKELKQFRFRKRANRSCAFDFIRSIRTAKQLLSSGSKFALDLEKLIVGAKSARRSTHLEDWNARWVPKRRARARIPGGGRSRRGTRACPRWPPSRWPIASRSSRCSARAIFQTSRARGGTRFEASSPRLARDARGARRERVRRAVARDPDADDGRFRRRGARRDRDRASDVARRLRGKKAPPDVV